MTFIASVIAKEGVAIIADSLVTTSKHLLTKDELRDYFDGKKEDDGDNITVDISEILALFKQQPSHTKDYEEKLTMYDKYTAITTAGQAYINGKKVIEIINSISDKNKTPKIRKSYARKKIETKVKDLCEELTKEVKEHIKKYNGTGNTIFIYTSYNKQNHSTTIYKIEVQVATLESLEAPNFEFVKYTIQPTGYKVICEGQNRISEKILFGDSHTIGPLVSKIYGSVIKLLKLNPEDLPEKFFEAVLKDADIIDSNFVDGLKIFQLSQLSLQQAVDLACLLMRLEMDLQKYTKNIPTVGGQIKLAVIDNDGFRHINGKEIVKPDII